MRQALFTGLIGHSCSVRFRYTRSEQWAGPEPAPTHTVRDPAATQCLSRYAKSGALRQRSPALDRGSGAYYGGPRGPGRAGRTTLRGYPHRPPGLVLVADRLRLGVRPWSAEGLCKTRRGRAGYVSQADGGGAEPRRGVAARGGMWSLMQLQRVLKQFGTSRLSERAQSAHSPLVCSCTLVPRARFRPGMRLQPSPLLTRVVAGVGRAPERLRFHCCF